MTISGWVFETEMNFKSNLNDKKGLPMTKRERGGRISGMANI